MCHARFNWYSMIMVPFISDLTAIYVYVLLSLRHMWWCYIGPIIELNWIELNIHRQTYAAEEGLRGRNVLQSVVNWYCYVTAHNQFAYLPTFRVMLSSSKSVKFATHGCTQLSYYSIQIHKCQHTYIAYIHWSDSADAQSRGIWG